MSVLTALQTLPLEKALHEVSCIPVDYPASNESLSFLQYIPSPQEEYEHLYKVFTEAEAHWE